MRRSILSFLWLAGFLAPALAFASTSVSLNSLSPSSTVSAGTTVSFSVGTSGFTNPSFNINDSFSSAASSITSGNINSSGNFSWTPAASDAGTHSLTISVNDSAGDTGSVTENITVINGPTLSLGSISPGYSVVVGQPLTFTVSASGFSNPVYTVGDSPANGATSLTANDISSGGDFSWTPSRVDIGAHTLIVTVVDSSGHSASQQLQITIQNPQVTVENLNPGGTVAAGQPLSFQILPTGFTNPSYDVVDSFRGTTLTTGNIGYASNSLGQNVGQVNWTPATQDVGSHTIAIGTMDSYNDNATDTITIVVTPNPSGAYIAPTTPTASVTPAPISVQVSSVAPSVSTQSTSPSTVDFTNSLALGSTGTQVTQLQALLANAGFLSAAPTGYYGVQTLAAVEKFQTAHGLATVGTVGPQTRAVLNKLASGSATSGSASAYTFTTELSPGSQGAAVTALQQRLSAAGVYSGPVTGYYGALTEAAVKKYQTAHGLSAVGMLGPQTRASLNQAE